MQTYFSEGADSKARRMTEQLDRVIAYYNDLIGFKPSVTLLVLSSGDWSKHTKFPVYGMPHYTNNKTLVVASEDNDFWKSFVPPLDKLPKEHAFLISEVYLDKNSRLTMEAFFDLLAIHELGHAYHIQDSLVMQRKWLGELFTNIFLHTYIAENEPGLLPVLRTFPKMVVSTTEGSTLKYRTLEDLEANYSEIAQKHPRNYGWFQCRWHMAAGTIYEAGGAAAFKNLWITLKKHRDILANDKLLKLLSGEVHPSVGEVQAKWE